MADFCILMMNFWGFTRGLPLPNCDKTGFVGRRMQLAFVPSIAFDFFVTFCYTLVTFSDKEEKP